MNASLFTSFRDLIYEQSGISLAESKQTLLQSRISKRMRTLGIQEEKQYLRRVIDDDTGDELVFLLDAISTNVTSFFREAEHFRYLDEALQGWLRTGQARIRLWSAACSSGQEPYTMVMSAMESLRAAGCEDVDLKVLATDISTRVLHAALQGEYCEREVRPVSPEVRSRYLRQLGSGPGAIYQVNDELRRRITFRRLNLSQPPFPMHGPFDAIFCRNVMIYFDQRVRGRLVTEMTRLLKPGGLLLIGHAESLLGLNAGLVSIGPSVYQKADRS